MDFHLHIGVLAFPFGSHAATLLNLVRRLAASAPTTKFSFFNSTTTSDSFDNIQPYHVWDGIPEVFSGTKTDAIELFFKASPGNYDKVIEEAELEIGLKISCLLSDAFLWFACDLAEKRSVPWVPFWAGGPCSLSAHIYTDTILDLMGSKGPEEITDQTISFIPGMSMVKFNDLPQEIFLNQNPTPLALTIYKTIQSIQKSKALVLNSFEEVDPVITNELKSKFHKFLNISPSILSSPTTQIANDGYGCLPWLKNQTRDNSVIYISFGTIITPPPNEIAALAEAIEAFQFPFLWSLKNESKKFLPDKFIERTSEFGKIVSWAPQLEVLQQRCVGVFITHCGWNSVLESVYGAVPMICRPFFGDHNLNARMVEDVWKIGVSFKGGVITKSEMIIKLQHLMWSNEAGNEIRDNVCKMREKGIDSVKLEGSSTKNFKILLELISK